MGAMERANRTMGEMLRTMKHATETRVGGRLETDPSPDQLDDTTLLLGLWQVSCTS